MVVDTVFSVDVFWWYTVVACGILCHSYFNGTNNALGEGKARKYRVSRPGSVIVSPDLFMMLILANTTNVKKIMMKR